MLRIWFPSLRHGGGVLCTAVRTIKVDTSVPSPGCAPCSLGVSHPPLPLNSMPRYECLTWESRLAWPGTGVHSNVTKTVQQFGGKSIWNSRSYQRHFDKPRDGLEGDKCIIQIIQDCKCMVSSFHRLVLAIICPFRFQSQPVMQKYNL